MLLAYAFVRSQDNTVLCYAVAAKMNAFNGGSILTKLSICTIIVKNVTLA